MTPTFTRFYVGLAAISLTFLACGEDTEGDSMPNILTGVTGVVIFCVIVWFLVKALRGRTGSGGGT